MFKENNTCKIEAAVKPPESGNMVSLPKLILERPDIAIIVTGAQACVRGIYKTVAALGKLHQLHYCVISEDEYTTEGWVNKYVAIINKVLQRPGLGGIIVYAGCLDCLAKVNLAKVRPLLNNPNNIPVEILLRGPVAATVRKPKDVLPELLAKIPPTTKKLDRNGFVLPPLLPDFVGVAAMLENWNSCNVVLDIGGCSACISPSNLHRTYANLKKTTFNSYADLKNNIEELTSALVETSQASASNTCVLLPTPVVKKTDLNISKLQSNLKKHSINALHFATDGYHTSIEGFAKVLLQFGEQAQKLTNGKTIEKENSLIGVLGADFGQCAFQDKIHHGVEHFLKDGYKALFLEQLPWEQVDKIASVKINWVVSAVAIPLAEYMQKEFGIPYFAAIPIGARAMFLWRNQVNKLMKPNNVDILEVPPLTKPAMQQKKVLIVGDPVLSAGLKRYFVAMDGQLTVARAVYSPYASLSKFYDTVNELESSNGLEDTVLTIKDQLIHIKDTKEWEALASRFDIIVCDKLMRLSIENKVKPDLWINIPDGIFSAGLVKDEDYTIFGKKGAIWLRKAQNMEVPMM